MYGYGFYYDRTYILLIIGMLLSVAASAKLKSTFAKYRGVRSASGLTGEQAARRILQAAGITDVQVRAVSGSLTDHYDPRTKTVNLSQDIFGQSSLAAVGVAAHECGHAIQHAIHYAPLEIRSAIVPLANFGSTLSWAAVFPGAYYEYPPSDHSGNHSVFSGSSVSACDSSGGDQCLFTGSAYAGNYGDSGKRGKFRSEKGFDSSGSYLCSGAGIINSSAFEADYSCRRT